MSWWYPRLSKHGNIASGNGEIRRNGHMLAPSVAGHSPQWFGDPEDSMVFIGDDARIIDVRTSTLCGQPGFTFNPRVGNTSGISAGAGHWCGWNVQQGLIYDGVCVDAGAAAGACDQKTGALYYLTPYQGDYKTVVLNGTNVRTGVIATELVAGEECATWGEYEGNRTLYGWSKESGVHRLNPLAPSEFLFVGVPVRTPDGLWLVTQTHAGLIVYPWGGYEGYILEGEFFYHHAMFLNGVVAIVATTGRGELVRCDVSLASPRTDLRNYRPSTGTPDSVCAIDKPLWLGWFEFTDALAYLPPANCQLRTGSGYITKLADGQQFAQWVQGGSVEAIEAAVAACSAWPCVAYWDARTWPRFPTLRPGDWLCHQWYCLKDETPEAFEANMRAVLATVPATYAQQCGVCQCYNTNHGLTTNLAGLVPVFARLARDYPQITMLLSFTDQGRSDPATGEGGLAQNPDVLPYWQQLYAGITGTPGTPEPPEPPDPETPMDHHAMNTFAIDWWNANNIRQRSIDMGGNANVPGTDKSYCLPLQQWAFRRIMTEAYFAKGFNWALMFWKDGFINAGDDEATIQRKLDRVGEDAYCYLTGAASSEWKDAVGHMGNVDANLNFLPPFYVSSPGDYAKCGPAPSLEFMIAHDLPPDGIYPPGPEPPEPQPGEIVLKDLQYATTAHRGDPHGFTVYWDMDSPHPIKEFEVGLVGTPEIFRLQVLEPYPPDGRYFRGLAWKVTQNGDWTLRLTVRDIHGNEATIDGPTPVHVTE